MLRSGMQLVGRAPGTPVTRSEEAPGGSGPARHVPMTSTGADGAGRPDANGESKQMSGEAPVGVATSARVVAMLASPFTWDDVAWIRGRWSGPLLVKGILSGGDATLAAEAGANAVIVSNHGGRQLEGAPATMRVLPEVVGAVGSRVEVLVDGGVRRGGDVVKALAMGARAVLVGRPYLYCLAAAGEAGVDRMLELLRAEMSRTMSLLGCPDVSDLDRSWLQGD